MNDKGMDRCPRQQSLCDPRRENIVVILSSDSASIWVEPHYGWADVVGDSSQLVSIKPRERPPGFYPALDFGSLLPSVDEPPDEFSPISCRSKNFTHIHVLLIVEGKTDGQAELSLEHARRLGRIFFFLQILGLLLSILKLSVERLGSMKKYVPVVSLPSKSLFRNDNVSWDAWVPNW